MYDLHNRYTDDTGNPPTATPTSSGGNSISVGTRAPTASSGTGTMAWAVGGGSYIRVDTVENLTAGIEIWHNRDYTFASVPNELEGGVLFRGPHRISSGSVLDIPITPTPIHALVHSPDRNGDFINSLPAAGWTLLTNTATWNDENGTSSTMAVLRHNGGSRTLPATAGECLAAFAYPAPAENDEGGFGGTDSTGDNEGATISVVTAAPTTAEYGTWQKFNNYCAPANSDDMTQTDWNSGNANLESCKSECRSKDTCSAVEFYPSGCCGGACKLILGVRATRGSPLSRFNDAECHIRPSGYVAGTCLANWEICSNAPDNCCSGVCSGNQCVPQRRQLDTVDAGGVWTVAIENALCDWGKIGQAGESVWTDGGVTQKECFGLCDGDPECEVWHPSIHPPL
jgi:hypothetical protein